MMPLNPLRIAILTHSTNPRGGVVHALELADALVGLGHDVAVHAPDPKHSGFFRPTRCRTVSVVAQPVSKSTSVADMVELRVSEYVAHFAKPKNRRFDIFHAHDGISGNALATLVERRLIPEFARTVHHIDDFQDARLVALQDRSIALASKHFVVSDLWKARLAQDFGVGSTVVGNGVDLRRYSPVMDGREAALRERLGLKDGPVFLAIGGIEERKNTIRIVEAFKQVACIDPRVQLVIAGGASILDHHDYRRTVNEARVNSRLRPDSIIETGAVAHEDMPALYRLADALVFPSLREGFGLVVLEAMASEVPVITSNMPPFSEYLSDEVLWCNPLNVASIADAMLLALVAPVSERLVERGRTTVRRFSWDRTAELHLETYRSLFQEHAFA